MAPMNFVVRLLPFNSFCDCAILLWKEAMKNNITAESGGKKSIATVKQFRNNGERENGIMSLYTQHKKRKVDGKNDFVDPHFYYYSLNGLL